MNIIYRHIGIAILLLLSVSLASCRNGGKKDTVTEFPRTGELRASARHILPFTPIHTVRSYVSGDFLVIQDYNSDFCYNVYMLPDLADGFTAGHIGRGPNEFSLSPVTLSPTSGDGSFEAYDIASGLLRRFMFEDKQLKFVEETKLLLPNNVYGNKLARLKENTYLCVNDWPSVQDGEIVLMDSENHTHEFMIDFPGFMREHASDKDVPLPLVAGDQIVSKPDGSRFGLFSLHYKYFRLFDGEGDRIREVKVNIKPYVNYNSQENIREYAYYTTVAASDDYIYAICVNFSASQPDKNPAELQIWDWGGNPVARYEFDEPPYYSCISMRDMKLYAFNHTDSMDEDGAIARVYDLSELAY